MIPLTVSRTRSTGRVLSPPGPPQPVIGAMAKLLPYFRWFPSDAESDDKYSAMTDEELGFFHRCLNKSWLNGGLPADPMRRSQVMRTAPKTADRLWQPWCWVPHPHDLSKVVNPRQEAERSEALKGSEARALAGSKGGKRSAMLKQCSSEPQPRTYGSVSVSGSESSSEEFEERFISAFSRHRKHRATETKILVSQMLLDVNWDSFDAAHVPFCEFWDRHDWTKCPLTMLEWFRNGMPGPPPEAESNGSPRRKDFVSDVERVIARRAARGEKLL